MEGGQQDRSRGSMPAPPAQKCPRCDSANTKFCYYNNYSLTQPRYFCKTCRRYWTQGGTLRNVPVGGGCRKGKRAKLSTAAASSSSPPPFPLPTGGGVQNPVGSLGGGFGSFYNPGQAGPGLLGSLAGMQSMNRNNQGDFIGTTSSSNLGLLQGLGSFGTAPFYGQENLMMGNFGNFRAAPVPQVNWQQEGYVSATLAASVAGDSAGVPPPLWSTVSTSSATVGNVDVKDEMKAAGGGGGGGGSGSSLDRRGDQQWHHGGGGGGGGQFPGYGAS